MKKEKKVSGEINDEELENVAGGWCATGGKSAPSEVTSVKKEMQSDGTYTITTEFKNGSSTVSLFNADGTMIGTQGSKVFKP